MYEGDLMTEEEIYHEFKTRIAKLYGVEEEDLEIKDTVTIMIEHITANENMIVELYKEAHERGMSLKEAILWVSEKLDDT